MVNERDPMQPLGRENAEQLDDALRMVDEVKPLLDRARAAGINLGRLPDELESRAQQARSIRTTFFDSEGNPLPLR